MPLPQQFDTIGAAPRGIAIANAERLARDARHGPDVRALGIAVFGREQANRLSHRYRRGQRRHPPHVHFGYDAIAQRVALQGHAWGIRGMKAGVVRR